MPHYSIDKVINQNDDLSEFNVYTGAFEIAQNAQIYAIAIDEAKNRSTVGQIQVSNIDKISPIGNVIYSKVSPTNQSVLATLLVNEEYEMLNDGERYYEFTSNGNHTFTFIDLAGNQSSITATVNNIDKTAPSIIDSSVTKDGATPTVVKGGDLLDVSVTVTDSTDVTGLISMGDFVVDASMDKIVDSQSGNKILTAVLQVPDDYDGVLDIVVLIKDVAGNSIEAAVLEDLAVDNTIPSFTVILSNDLVNGFITDDDVSINVISDGADIVFGMTQATINQSVDNLETVINNNIYNDGKSHIIYFKAVDAAGNASDVSTLEFKWDSIAPVQPTISADVSSPTNIKTIVLSGSAEAGTVTIRRTLDTGIELIFAGDSSAFVQGITVDLRPGSNVFTITNSDLAKNMSSSNSMTINYDGTAPILDVTRAEDGTITIVSTEDLSDVTYTLDGILQAAPIFTNKTATIAAIQEEGEHYLVINGSDSAGNIGIGRLSFFTVPANQAITKELSDGITMNEGTFTEAGELEVKTFEVSAGDDNGFVGEPINFELSGTSIVDPEHGVIVDLNIGLGFPVNTKLNYYNETEDIWEALDNDIDNGDSLYNNTDSTIMVNIDPFVADAITVDANGSIEVLPGHIVGFLRHFSGYAAIEDVTPPIVQVLNEELTAPRTVNTFTVSVYVSEEATLTVNGVQENSTRQAGTHEFVMNLNEGNNVFTVFATDLAGLNSATQSYEAEYDGVIESLTSNLNGVNNNSVVTSNIITVNATAVDRNFASIEINGVEYNNASVTTNINLVEGLNTIQVIAKDSVGHTDTDAYSITLDTTGPIVQINGMSEGDIIGSDVAATISGNADLDHYSWSLSNASGSLANGTSAINYNVPDGTKDDYTLLVIGYDAVNNQTRSTINFTVDQSAPVINISAIPAVSNQSQTFTMTVAPYDANTEIKIYQNGIRISSLSATKVEHVNEDYSTYTIEFVDEGEYEVKVNAINQATAANKAIAFEIDKTVPTITISGVSDGQTITTQPTIIYSSQDTVSATLAKDGGAAQAIGSNYKVTENGSYAFVVSAVDNAGNTNVRSINFTVNISVVNPGGGGGGVVPAPIPVPVTDLPVVEPIEETKVIGIEDKVIFEEVQITMDLTETVMTVGTEITVKSYEKTSDAEGLSLSVENGMIIKIASEIYEFNASEEFEGQIEITIPYDPTKVTDPKKLTVSTYDEKHGKWKLIGGKVNTTHYSY
jgi:hypothetical protein